MASPFEQAQQRQKRDPLVINLSPPREEAEQGATMLPRINVTDQGASIEGTGDGPKFVLEPTAEPEQKFVLEPMQAQSDEFSPTPTRDLLLGDNIPASGWRRAAKDMSVGFNNMMINTLGIAPEAADRLLKAIGTSGFLENPGDGVKMLRSAAKQLGITIKDPNAPKGLAEKIGEATFQQLLLTSAMFAAAPALAANTLTTTAGAVGRTMGSEMLKRPGMLVAGELGAVIGSEGAAHVTPDWADPYARMVGGIVGGGAGMGAATSGRKDPGKMFGAGNARRALGEEQIPDTIKPIARGAEAPDHGQIVEALRGDQMRIERLLDDTLKSVQTRIEGVPDPAGQATILRDSMYPVYKRAGVIEDAYWKRADTSRSVDTAGFKDDIQRLLKETVQFDEPTLQSEVLPGDFVREIMKLPESTSIQHMMDIRSLVLERLRGETMSMNKSAQGKMRKSLNAIQSSIVDGIASQYPNDRALQEARAFSAWKHDRLTRGPLSRFGPKQQTDIAMTDPLNNAQSIMRDTRTGREMADIGSMKGGEGKVAAENAQQMIREQFREMAEADPAKGLAWLNAPQQQRFIKEFPELDREAAEVTNALTKVLKDQTEFNKSAFISANQGEGPQVAIDRLFTAPNKVGVAKDLVRRLGDNQPAKDALTDAVVRQLLDRAKNNPEAMQRILNGKDMKNMLLEVMPSDAVQRFDRVLSAAVHQQKFAGTVGAEAYRQTVGRGSRIIGAIIGRYANSGTLQGPQQGSEAAFQLQKTLMRDFTPEDLMTKAIQDPRWERFLLQRTPETRKEWERAFKQMKYLIGAQQQLVNDNLDRED